MIALMLESFSKTWVPFRRILRPYLVCIHEIVLSAFLTKIAAQEKNVMNKRHNLRKKFLFRFLEAFLEP